MVAAIIFPYIGRRLAQARGGRKASEMREGRFSDNPVIDDILKKRKEK